MMETLSTDYIHTRGRGVCYRIRGKLEKIRSVPVQFASELNRAGEYEKSNMVLLECCNYMNDAEMQMLLASNFEKLDELDSAAQSLILASRMIPVRFFPLYRLAKLHEKNNENAKAFEVAERIIHKKVKIPSMKITVMKDEMEELISDIKQINAGEETGSPPHVGDVQAKTDMK